MANKYEQRTGKGYEIQYYDHDGNYKFVVGAESLEEVAHILIRECNGNVKGNFPTVWYNGHMM